MTLFSGIAFGKSDSPDPNDGLFFIAPRSAAIVDGDLSEWAAIPPVVLDNATHARYLNNDWGGREDCSVRFWWGWDDAGLLVAAEVIDDSLSFPNTGYRIWANDCIQFTIDVMDDNSTESYENDDHEFVVSLLDSMPRIFEFTFSEYRSSGIRPYPCAMQLSGDTVRYELQIPWDALGMVGPKPGHHIGASLVVFDNDGEDYRGHIEWTKGIVSKKFTLPFANILLFDKRMKMVQSIASQPFLSEKDTLELWVYTGYWRRNVTCRLMEENDILSTEKYRLKREQWRKIEIAPDFMKAGHLQLEVASRSISRKFDIAVWSKSHITNQLTYLIQQSQVLESVKKNDPTVHMLVRYWSEWLNNAFASAKSNFEYFNVMQQAQKRIDLIPNFYMDQEVYLDREYRIVEKMYYSKLEKRAKRYMMHLPFGYKKELQYPLIIVLSDGKKDISGTARKIARVLTENSVQALALFPDGALKEPESRYLASDVIEQITECSSKFRVDSTRTYLISESRFSHDAMRLIQDQPDRFAALSLICERRMDPDIVNPNVSHTPIHLWIADKDSLAFALLNERIRSSGGHLDVNIFPWDAHTNIDEFYNHSYFQWLLKFKKNKAPRQVRFAVDRMQPSKAYWLEIGAQENYFFNAYLNAEMDTNQIRISTENLSAFSVIVDHLPAPLKKSQELVIDSVLVTFIDSSAEQIDLRKIDGFWRVNKDSLLELNSKNSMAHGPIAALFEETVLYVYSTGHEDADYNEMTRKMAEMSSRCKGENCAQNLVFPDTVLLKQSIESNVMVFGDDRSNKWLQQFSGKLPVRTLDDGALQFGKSIYYEANDAAVYVYPNPLNHEHLMLVCSAANLSGLDRLEKVWHLDHGNAILDYDYVFIDDRTSSQEIITAADYGYFDNSWETKWYKNRFRVGPKRWFTNTLVGFDANQLSFNSNWKGGGKGSFTWKLYLRSGFDYKRKAFNWQNSLYCAFGQISLQEQEKWRSPEKSNDAIDFDSVLRFNTEQFIDPYLSLSMDTQFQNGYDSKTKELVSGFFNPLQLTMSAGMAKNLIQRKNVSLTTRLGSGIKEVIVKDARFRKRWTGDESRGVKSHGGVEWTTEFKTDFTKNVRWTNKLKLFQAVLSSISKQKDPDRNWQKMDVYLEQTFTVQFNKLVLFTVMTKFLYDRDTSGGGQFLENASLGLSYRFQN
jgi:hypothetical protein